MSVAVAIVGFGALSFGGYQVWALRNLKVEVDRLSKENTKLEATEVRLQNQVGFLQVKYQSRPLTLPSLLNFLRAMYFMRMPVPH